MAKKTTDREEWVECALQLLGKEGIERVTIDRLCSLMGLTKGSFYWHFKGRQVLLSAMAEGYLARSKKTFGELNKLKLSPMRRLQRLSEWASATGQGNIDRAMRIWAGSCEETAHAVVANDKAFLKYVKDILKELGMSTADAGAVAKLILAHGAGVALLSPSLGTSGFKDSEKIFEDFIVNLVKANQQP